MSVLRVLSRGRVSFARDTDAWGGKGGLLISSVVFSLGLLSSPAAAFEPVKLLVVYHSVAGNTEKLALGVVEGAQQVAGAEVLLRRPSQVTQDELLGTDALVVGSPVYWGNMAGEIKTFFDQWQLRFGIYPEFKMHDKVGAVFATGGQISGGKELTMLSMLAAMLGNRMIVVGGGGPFGASATTEGDSPGIDQREMEEASALGRRVAEVAKTLKRGRVNEAVETH